MPHHPKKKIERKTEEGTGVAVERKIGGGEGVDLEIGQGHGVEIEIETDEEIGQGHETETTDADEDQGAAVAKRTRKNGGEKIARNCQWTQTLEGFTMAG